MDGCRQIVGHKNEDMQVDVWMNNAKEQAMLKNERNMHKIQKLFPVQLDKIAKDKVNQLVELMKVSREAK